MLEQVYQKYNCHRVAFVAVSIDPPDVETLACTRWPSNGAERFRWPVTLAQRRHGVSHSRRPTMMVLGPDGTLQDQEVGLDPKLATDLPAVIEALLAGKSTAARPKARAEQLTAEYQRPIQEPPVRAESQIEGAAGGKSRGPRRTAACQAVAPAGRPRTSKCREYPGRRRSEKSKIAKDLRARRGPYRRESSTPKEKSSPGTNCRFRSRRSSISCAPRSTRRKRYYAGSASGQQQLFLFDDNWALRLVLFPSAEIGDHAGIGE